jgi:pyridoxamine 5'-phosphate oxidase
VRATRARGAAGCAGDELRVHLAGMEDGRKQLGARLALLRQEYARAGLDEGDLAPTPLGQLERWLTEAMGAGVEDANAVTLATATPDGAPSARIVLLKGLDARGVTFFTNYESAKGRELAANPRAALVAFWHELERQVRLIGDVERLTREESEAYFHTRPLGSQLGAWASPQSAVVPGRTTLDARLAEASARYGEGPVPLPPFWGGYRLLPRVVEFWQGRPSRMHDRLVYTADTAGRWAVQRLAP